MGLFGSIFKAVGKVAQAGLNSLTHGASNQVLKVLKGRGQVKQVLAKGPNAPTTTQEAALVRKRLPVVQLGGAGKDFSYGPESRILDLAGAMGNVEGYKSKGSWKKKSSKASASAPRAAPRSASPRSTSRQPTRTATRSSSKAKRSLPPALAARAQAMRDLSVRWHAEGEPGRWIDYVKANL